MRRDSARPLVLIVAVLLVATACSGATKPEAAGQGITADGTAEVSGDGVDFADGEAGTSGESGAASATAGGTKRGARGTGTVSGPASSATKGASGTSTAAITLFDAATDRIGITDSSIKICAHAALTYAPAFNTGEQDLNVYWDNLNDTRKGVHNRKVEVLYENDNYSGPDAIAAAERCKQRDPFFTIGGIGFDQIPSVRDWAEKNKMLYVHHTATVEGSENKQYSYTGLPTTEKMGEMFAELILWKFKDKKIGILGRDSANFMPGIKAFKKVAAGRINVVKEIYTPKDKHNYALELGELQNAGAEVVWGWESALASTEMIQQAKNRNYHPTWLVFPFNLESQTLGDQAINPKIFGVAMFNGYSHRDYSGEFAKYADDIKEFERQYAKYRPNVDLSGVGGDLLFLNWQGQKALHAMLDACGADCTRNKFANTMRNWKVPRDGSACALDFTRDGNRNRGGWQVSVMETYKAPSGKVNWRNIVTCAEHLI